jgi:hypothetical protein
MAKCAKMAHHYQTWKKCLTFLGSWIRLFKCFSKVCKNKTSDRTLLHYACQNKVYLIVFVLHVSNEIRNMCETFQGPLAKENVTQDSGSRDHIFSSSDHYLINAHYMRPFSYPDKRTILNSSLANTRAIMNILLLMTASKSHAERKLRMTAKWPASFQLWEREIS